MKYMLLTLSCVGFLALFSLVIPVRADIIGPQLPAKEIPFPEALLTELDGNVAEQLKPLMSLFANNDLAGFKDAYLKIASSTDTLPAVEVFWAKLLITSNRFADATRILEEFVRDHQEDPEVYLTMGILAAKTGRFTDAWLHLGYAQRLIDRNLLAKARLNLVLPNLIDARCVVAESRRQWKEAEQLFQKLQSLKPEDHSVKWRAGRCQVLADKISIGHQLMIQACEANPKLPRATLAVAQILSDSTNWVSDKNRAKEVETWYTQAIDESPTDDKAIASYFKWLLLDNRPETVRDKFEPLTDELKSVREIIIIRSLAARYLGDLTLAEHLLTPLHQAKPDDLEVADQLALILVESKDESKRGRALQLSERNFRAASDVEAVAATAAWIQMQLGSTDVADKILTQLVSRGPLSAQTAYYVSELLQRSGREVESRKLMQAAVDTVGLFPQREKTKQALAKSP
jgi:tetratricopeptide (TPR) repeat protein